LLRGPKDDPITVDARAESVDIVDLKHNNGCATSRQYAADDPLQ